MESLLSAWLFVFSEQTGAVHVSVAQGRPRGGGQPLQSGLVWLMLATGQWTGSELRSRPLESCVWFSISTCLKYKLSRGAYVTETGWVMKVNELVIEHIMFGYMQYPTLFSFESASENPQFEIHIVLQYSMYSNAMWWLIQCCVLWDQC